METVAQAARVHKSSGEGLVREDGSVHPGWRTTFASGLGMMFGPSPILLFTFGTFVAPLSREFGWTVAAITAGAMIVNLLLVVCSMVQGFAVDLFGPRKLILASIPVFGLAVAAMAWLTPNIVSFYLALALAAVCAVGIWPVAYNKAIAGWFDERLGLTLGLGNAGIGLGAALLPVISAYVISNHGWRTAYVVLGIIAVLIPWPAVFALLKDPPAAGTPTRPSQVSAAAPGLSFSEARRTPAFFITLAGFLLLGTFSSSSVIHQIGILTDTGLTVAQATLMQSVLGVSLILGRVGSGWLLDRIQASSILVVMCLGAAGALVLLYAGAPWGTAPLCAALIGLVIGAEFDVLGFLIARYFGQKSFGVLYATIFASFQLFASAAIPLVGLVKSKTGAYGPALATLAGLMVLAAFLFWRLGPYRYPTKRAMAHG
jgi:MFS family permease